MSYKNWPKPKVGVSSCLLGNRVRHNNEHKKNDWLLGNLGPYVTWIPICPEVEMGLGVPRETMRLIGESDLLKLVTVKTQLDLTDKAHDTYKKLFTLDYSFDGYIFKKDSPTCGLERVKVYPPSGIPAKIGIGLFAQQIKNRYPHIPKIEEGRLSDLKQREHFLIRLFSWTEFKQIQHNTSDLQLYHQNHKLQFMAYDPQGYRTLGKIAANSDRRKPDLIFEDYGLALSQLLHKTLTIRKNINVFQHMLGYFKKILPQKDKAHVLRLFEDYRNEKIPIVSLSTIFGYLIEKYSVSYLSSQSILEPYPKNILREKTE